MSDLVVGTNRIPAMSETAIEQVRALEALTLQAPQVAIPTFHVFHAGMYARTITVPAGVVLTGALIKCATLLIINGDGAVFIDGKATGFSGYNVMAASAGRKQAFVAHTDTDLTMIFTTDAETVEDAEEQFTDEADLLFSRLPGAANHVMVTGE